MHRHACYKIKVSRCLRGSFFTPRERARRDRHVAPHRAEQRVLITLCKCGITTKTGGRSKSSVSRPRRLLRDVKGAIAARGIGVGQNNVPWASYAPWQPTGPAPRPPSSRIRRPFCERRPHQSPRASCRVPMCRDARPTSARTIMQTWKGRLPPIGAAPRLMTLCASGLPTLCAWSDGPRECTAVQKLERCAIAANRARKVHEAHPLTGARLAETIS